MARVVYDLNFLSDPSVLVDDIIRRYCAAGCSPTGEPDGGCYDCPAWVALKVKSRMEERRGQD